MTHIIRFYNKRFSRLQGSSDVRAVPIRQEEVQSPHAGAGNQRKARKRKAKQKICDLDVVALFL